MSAVPDAVWRGRARKLLARALKARVDPVAFIELVAREEHTRARVKLPPHLRVLVEFLAAHSRAVVRIFVGGGKTWTAAHLGLFLLGGDPAGRGANVGASAEGASQALALMREMVADEGGDFPELHLVFPELRPTERSSEPWGQNRITVRRPPGIRDPSWTAVGASGRLPGRRLKWIVGDDMLDEENTATPAARDKFSRRFAMKVLTRLDVRGGAIWLLNTPWDQDDLTYRLEATKVWPTISIEIEGEVRITNTAWTSHELRPSKLSPGAWRLRANDAHPSAPLCEVMPDGRRRRLAEGEVRQIEESGRSWTIGAGALVERYDLDEQVPAWPDKFDRPAIESIRDSMKADPSAWFAKYKLRPRVPADEAKKRAWIEECKLNARALGPDYWTQKDRYRGPNLTVTGLDLATGAEDGSDWRALFTFEVVPELRFHLPDGRLRHLANARRLLRVRYGRWVGEELVRVVERDVEAFDSVLRVETNGGADHLRQWLAARQHQRPDAVPFEIHAHVTTAENKNARRSGIPGLFIVLENLAWIIPCDAEGECEEDVQRWLDGLLAWRPELHPDDGVVASWLAHEQARLSLGDSFLGVDLASVEARFRG